MKRLIVLALLFGLLLCACGQINQPTEPAAGDNSETPAATTTEPPAAEVPDSHYLRLQSNKEYLPQRIQPYPLRVGIFDLDCLQRVSKTVMQDCLP